MKRIQFYRLFFLLALSVLATTLAEAQILSCLDSSFLRNDSVFFVLRGGKNHGLEVGDKGTVMASYNKKYLSDNFSEMGSGFIVEVYQTQSLFYRAMKVGISRPILMSDYVRFNKKALPTNSLIQELANKAIFLQDHQSNMLYPPEEVWNNNYSDKHTYTLLQKEIELAIENEKKKPDSLNRLSRKLNSKRYPGKTVEEVLQQTGISDINSFFYYVISYSDSYSGNKYAFSSFYIDWLMAGADKSSAELNLEWQKLTGKPQEQKKWLLENAAVIKSTGFLNIYFENSYRAYKNNQWSDCRRWNLEGIELCLLVGDSIMLGPLWYIESFCYQNEENFPKMLEANDSALKYLPYHHNKYIHLSSSISKGFAQYKCAQYKQAVSTLEAAIKLTEKYKPVIPGGDYNEAYRKILEYLGLILSARGKNDAAILAIRSAIAINRDLKTISSIELMGGEYRTIGQIYKSKNVYDSARMAYDSSLILYQSAGSAHNVSVVYNDLGALYYDMSLYSESMEWLTKAYNYFLENESWSNAGYSKALIGHSLDMLKNTSGSLVAHEESLSLRRKAGKKDGLANSWKSLGDIYEKTGQKKTALTAFDSSMHYYTLMGDSTNQAMILLKIGKVYENDKEVEKAITYYQRAEQIQSRIQNMSGHIEALEKLGSITFSSDIEASEKYYTQALTLSRESKAKESEMYAMINLGSLQSKKFKFKESKDWLEKALPLADSSRNYSMIAFCLKSMGGLAQAQMQYKEAFSKYWNAASIYDTVDRKEYYDLLSSLAHLQITTGSFDSSEIIYKQIINQANKQDYKLEKANAMLGLSFLYFLQANYKESMNLTDSASEVFQKSGNKISLASVYINKAIGYSGLGDFKEALRYYQLADSIYVQEKYIFERPTIANNIGVVYSKQSDYRKALQYYQQAQSLRTNKSINEEYVLYEMNSGECYVYLKKYDSAMAILDPLYTLAKQNGIKRYSSSISISLARCYQMQGKEEAALPYAEESLQFSTATKVPAEQIESLLLLGSIYRKSNPEKSYEYLQKSSLLASKYPNEASSWEAFFELGEYYYQQKKLKEAIIAYKESVRLLDITYSNLVGGEEARKTFESSGKKPELYGHLISSLKETGQVEEAFAYAQKTQLVALKDMMGQMETGSNNAEKSKSLIRLNELKQEQAGLEKNIEKVRNDSTAKGQLQALLSRRAILQKEYLNYLDSLKKVYPEIDVYFAENVNPAIFKGNKDMIPPDMAVLLYIKIDKQLLIFTATNKKVGVEEVTLSNDLDKMVEQYVANLSNAAFITGTGSIQLRSTIKKKVDSASAKLSFKALADRLYAVLISPVEAEIKEYKSICIIPNGKLCSLPFAAIGKLNPDSSVSFLADQFNISYTNKFDVFMRPGRTDRSLQSFTAFGNPDNTLKSAGEEATAIGKMLNVNTIYLSNDATETRAKESLEKSRYVHFATHGVLNYTEFSNSYLKMATSGNKEEDGELRINEIKTIDIEGCELVTLSACETAVNQEMRKGWYISPANAFLVNSVRSVVATLWAVDDKATSIFMQEFYKNLQTMDKSQALRTAQATLSKMPGFQHPFYWAPFVLYGDWR